MIATQPEGTDMLGVAEMPEISTTPSIEEASAIPDVNEQDTDDPLTKRIKLEGVDESAPMYVLTVTGM
jgi:hypothetical protein